MKITILTFGTSGDVIPYVALAQGLMGRDHKVTLAAPENFEAHIRSQGVECKPIRANSQHLLESENGMKWMAAGNIRKFMKELGKLTYELRYQFQQDTMDACSGADLIVGGTLMIYQACTLSEKLNVPMIRATVNPVSASTSAFPHFLVSPKPYRFAFLNRLTYTLVFKSYYKQQKKEFNEWRKNLGLQPMAPFADRFKSQKIPVVHGYSACILPKPRDWGDYISVSGVWKTDEKFRKKQYISNELLSWIKAGSPPVYFGFGSMPVTNPQQMYCLIDEVCKETGIRGIINAGWTDFSNNNNNGNDRIYFNRDFLDLESLFPMCSVLVHHGGVGTTHLGIEAGVPTLICSIFADNPLWGEQLKRLNIGTHIRYKNLTKSTLAKALLELQDEKIRERTALVGKKLKAENGLKNAVDFILQNASSAPVYSNYG